MARPIDPTSRRSRNRTFTGAEVAEYLGRLESLSKPKRARKVRQGSEFSMRDLIAMTRPPIIGYNAYSWDLSAILDARDQQMLGYFDQPYELAKSMRTDDAIFTARSVRIAPVQALRVELSAVGGVRGDRVAAAAEPLFGQGGIALSPDTLADIRGDIADFGVAVAVNVWNPRADGSQVDVELRSWPMKFVWWHAAARTLVTRIDPYPGMDAPLWGGLAPQAPDPYGYVNPTNGAALMPIVHGDGRWVVFSKHRLTPWQQDAAILPASLVWAGHAFAARDWAKSSASHGNAKVIGTLPESVQMQVRDDDGNASISPDVTNFLALLQDVASLDQPVGVKPFGSTIDILANPSGAWEVFERLMTNREKAAARIYLGTDGILGSQGGAPGVDISQLFGVATSKTQSDLEAICRSTQTGTIEPWAAINFGDSALSPNRVYVFPDPDEERVRADFAKRNAAFLADVKAARDSGLVVTQEWADTIAARHGVPTIQVQAAPTK